MTCILQDTHQHYVRLLMLKMLPLPLVKLLVKTRIFQMIFGRFMAVINRTIKDALDDLTDNEELKNVLTYFGYLDLGKCLSGIFQYIRSQVAIQKGNC